MAQGGYAKTPLIERIERLRSPTHFLYGDEGFSNPGRDSTPELMAFINSALEVQPAADRAKDLQAASGQVAKDALDVVLFETISAFATVGLSTGLSGELPPSGKYVLSAMMFFGRVGSITLASALALRQRRQLYHYPEERPIIG